MRHTLMNIKKKKLKKAKEDRMMSLVWKKEGTHSVVNKDT